MTIHCLDLKVTARPHSHDFRPQHGQAITEFVIMCMVLVPLFLAVVYTGKLSDAKQSAVQASRYVAWERVADPGMNKSNDQLQKETEVRMIGNPARNAGKLRSDDYTKSTSIKDVDYNPMWFSHSHVRMLNKLTDATVGGPQDSAVPGASGKFGTLEAVVMGVNQKGWIQADVEIPLLGLPQNPPNKKVKFSVVATNVVLADTWGAGGKDDVIDRAGRVAPETKLFNNGVIRPVLDLLRTVAGIFEPSFRKFYPGCIAPDVVPKDRIKNFSGYGDCTY